MTTAKSVCNQRKNTLTVQLSGGLGNQLFEFTAGLALSRRLEKSMNVDLSEIANVSNSHGNSLEELGLEAEFVNLKKGRSPLFYFGHRVLVFIQRKLGEKAFKLPIINRVYSSDVSGYDPKISGRTSLRFIRGYFQSYLYLQELRSSGVELEIQISNPTSWLKNHIELVEKLDPAIIHLRRGDYFSQGDEWGVLSADYYKKIITEILRTNAQRAIWIFSDDIDAAKAELTSLGLENLTFISPPNDSTAAESLYLMSFAKTIAIANSTFSWWAAALGNQKDIVYAPSRWFRSKTEPSQLIPPTWVRIDSEWC